MQADSPFDFKSEVFHLTRWSIVLKGHIRWFTPQCLSLITYRTRLFPFDFRSWFTAFQVQTSHDSIPPWDVGFHFKGCRFHHGKISRSKSTNSQAPAVRLGLEGQPISSFWKALITSPLTSLLDEKFHFRASFLSFRILFRVRKACLSDYQFCRLAHEFWSCPVGSQVFYQTPTDFLFLDTHSPTVRAANSFTFIATKHTKTRWSVS